MAIFPLTKRSPIDIASTRVEVSNTFPAERFVALAASGWALADNTDAAKRAVGWLVASDPGQFWFVVAREVVEWSGHGFALDAELWLGTSGQVVTTKPTGVEVVQKVGKVLDADHVQLFPEGGADESDYVLLSGRSGGQTILQGVTLEGGVTINDLDVDVDFLVKALAGVVGLYVDGATGRVGIGTQSIPAGTVLEVAGGGVLVGNNRSVAFRESGGQARNMFTLNTSGHFVLGFGVASNRQVRVAPNNQLVFVADGGGNGALFGTGSFGSGVGVLFIANRTTPPGSNPAGGALLYAESGDLKKRTSGGTDSKLLSEAEGDGRYSLLGHDHDTEYAPIAPAGKAYWLLHTDGRVKQSFYTSSAPEQWVRETDSELNDTMVRLVTTGGGTATTFGREPVSTAKTEGRVLTVGHLPSAELQFPKRQSGSGGTLGGLLWVTDATFQATAAGFMESQGNDEAHDHDVRIRYADFLVARFTG